tara:strand:- start:29 stop:538 length:510 start_codon:yes stop_codon:yes gene_type:complete
VIVLGIDPGPVTHGAVVYDSVERRVVWSDKAATQDQVEAVALEHSWERLRVVMERPAAMGAIGSGVVGHMLDTAWEAGAMSEGLSLHGYVVCTMTRREVLRHLGVLSGKGSPDARVRAACIADHETPGGPPAVGRKASPGPLYGLSSHSWQALGLVLAWLNFQTKGNEP